jgi:hypothetical protein
VWTRQSITNRLRGSLRLKRLESDDDGKIYHG